MSILGIIAEYDPFHNGHAHHMREAISTVAPSAVIVALSGPFKQRGETALLSPFTRAECALSAGADAVVSLPVLWTVRDAEHYALGAVHMLSSLGATHLAFGAETADLKLLNHTADLLENPPVSLRESLQAFMADGCGYPSALARAAGDCLPECRALFAHPNNILAICYLRAIRRLRLNLDPVVIPRLGAYHAEEILPDSPSASALRNALCRGAWHTALPALPPESERVVRAAFMSGTIPDPAYLDAVLLSKLRSMTPDDASMLPDCQEGLDRALLKAASHAGSVKELISLLTSRRYPSSRISRLCTHALLGITGDILEQATLPDAGLLLALKKNPSVTGSWKNSPVHIVPAADWLESEGPIEREAWRLWSLASGLPASYPFTQKLITVS